MIDKSIGFLLLSKDNLNGLNGAVKFIKLLSGDKEFWKKKNINVMVFSNSSSFSRENEYRKSFKFKIKKCIKSVLNSTIWGKRIKFKHDIFILGKNIITSVKNEFGSDSWILLNDFSVAYVFLKKYKNQYKTIVMMHNNGELFSMIDSYLQRDSRTKRILYKIEEIIFKNATKIVFVSENSKKNFCRLKPQYVEKAIVIYNGLPIRKESDSEKCVECLHLVTVGTVGKRKNQIMIIRALDEIKDKSIKLTVVGDGEELNNCKKFVKEHGLDNRIRFTGATYNVNTYLKESNMFIMASMDEGLPISAQEAMREGLPLILTDVGGCKELIKDNGLLISPDYNEVKKAIEYVNQNKYLLSEWGKKSKLIFNEKFTDIQMKNAYYHLITS